VDVTRPDPEVRLVSGRLGLYSPDGTLIAYSNPLRGTTVIERLADGQTWEIATQGRRPRFTPDSRQLMWTVYDEDAPRDTRVETVWLADVDGSNARVLLRAARTDVIGWLSDDMLLISQRVPGSSDETLLTLALADGRQTELLTIPEPRGMAFSPDNRHLIYTVTFEPDVGQNGIWLLDLEDIEAGPQKLPFFGTYRWRDSERLIYIPFDPQATEHNFYEYNITSGQSRPLFPAGTKLKVANNDWQVSPDGRKIALVAANGNELAGIRVLDLD
jgi:Tol biopolymer transport system component